MQERSKYLLTEGERKLLRQKKIKQALLADIPADELQEILNISQQRARELHGFYTFIRIPSIGKEFAIDLLSSGYTSLDELRDQTGPSLVAQLEKATGVRHDPCVEDQCRLVVHYAIHGNTGRQWWHFTDERKAYRAQNS